MTAMQRQINAITGVNRNRALSRANRNNLMTAMERRGYTRTGPDEMRRDPDS